MRNLKPAIRSLLSTPGPSLLMMGTLAIAIGANTAIFSVVQGVLLKPLGYPDDGRLVVLWSATESSPGETFRLSPADYRDLSQDAASFAGQVALYRSIGSTLTGLEQPARVGSFSITPSLFRVLRTRPAAGRLFSEDVESGGDRRQIVLTYSSWLRRFGGDRAIIGSTLDIDGAPWTVAGVAEEGFQFPPGNEEVELFLPMILTDEVLLDRNHRMFDSVARLDEEVSLASARDELSALGRQLAAEFPDTNSGWSIVARPLRDELLGDVATMLGVIALAVFLVLLIACAGIANLQVARWAASTREFAVRAALGAPRRDLLMRSGAESLLLGLLGGAAGIPLALAGVALLRNVMPANIPRITSIGVDFEVLLFGILLSLGCAVLFGAGSALRSFRPDLAEVLRRSGTAGGKTESGTRLRQSMVTLEVALAIMLLVAAGLMVRSFLRLSRVDPGFQPDGVASVAVQLPGSRYRREEWRPFFERFLEQLEAVPGVLRVGAVSDLPMSDVGLGFELEFTVSGLESRMPTARPNADIRLVLPGYFSAMRMPIRKGRDFERLDATSSRPVAIINETLARRYFQEIEPLGRTLRMSPLGEVEIVGIVADIRHRGLQAKYESEIYLPYGRFSTAEMQLVLQSGLEISRLASAVQSVLSGIDPQLAPSRVVALSDLLRESVAEPRFNTALLSLLALCATLLALFGIYGIVAYLVTLRSHEIGIRMALGANASATVRMIVSQALGMVLPGAALGVGGALLLARFLKQLLYEVTPSDPITYGWVVAAAILVGALAAWLPARHATRIDPILALRGE